MTSKTNGAAESERQLKLRIEDIEVDWKINARNAGEPIDPNDPEVQKLKASIQARGLLENLVVWEIVEPPKKGAPDGALGKVRFVLAAGFRRYVAIRALKHTHAHCRVVVGTMQDILLANGEENMIREDLTTYDKAKRCSEMKAQFGMSGGDLAASWQLGKSTVNHWIRVYEGLAPKLLEIWRRRDEAFEDFKRIVTAAKDHEEQLALWDELQEERKAQRSTSDGDDEEGGGGETETVIKPPRMRRREEIESWAKYDVKQAEEIKIPGEGWLTFTDDEKKVVNVVLRAILNAKKPAPFRSLAADPDEEG